MALFQPLTIGTTTLNNRVALAPMTRGRAGAEQIVKEELHGVYYKLRDSAGLLITEGTFISEVANGWVGAPGIYTQEQADAWKKVTSGVTSAFFVQLWHCGRASHTSFHPEQGLPVAPSAVKHNGEYIHTPNGKESYETPRALTIEEIKSTVQDFKKAAEFAKQAGFTGVEVHGASGYLIDTFLQSKTNLRDDDYGGSHENRFRFLREVLEAVLEVFPEKQVGLRLSPNGVYNDMGSPDFRESFTYYIQQLEKYPLAYLHVVDGLAFGFHQLGEPYTLAEVRANYSGVIIGNCGYTKEDAEKAIESGNADLIAFGRPFISNPDLPLRFKNNWPLNEPAPFSVFYSPGIEGYLDFPTYEEKH